MSKRALAILAAVEGIIIVGLIGLLVVAPGVTGGIGGTWSRVGMFGPFHGGMMGGWGWAAMPGVGLGWLLVRWVIGLIPIALVALVIALVLRPGKGSEERKVESGH